MHLYLIDDRLLVDLGGEMYGPACRFSYFEMSPSRDRMIGRSTIVRANLTNCQGLRSCGAGWHAMRCEVPPYHGPTGVDGAMDVTVEATINGQDFTTSGRTFRYYDPASWRVLSFAPLGGPLTGNTSVTIQGNLLQSLGDVRCRFGEHEAHEEVNATFTLDSFLTCTSPPHWAQSKDLQHVELQVTLNGQDYLTFGLQATQVFTYYRLNGPTHGQGLSVVRLSPHGGPGVGGTLVTVIGTGFTDLALGGGGLMCSFGSAQPSPATMVDGIEDSKVKCYSPPSRNSTAFEVQPVEVTINGQLHASTNSGIGFSVYQRQDVRVSKIYPRGGPEAGGLLVTVYGKGFVDLDHGHGLFCSFGDREKNLSPASAASAEVLTCISPPRMSPEEHESCPAGLRSSVPLRITLNGNNSADGGTSAFTADKTSELLRWHYFQSQQVGTTGSHDGKGVVQTFPV